MFDLFQLPFVQRGLIEILILSVAAGLIGTWVVLRGMAFFAHAVGTAAFPGLVLADGLAFSAHLGAAGTALIVAGGVGWLSRRHRDRFDSATALVLIAALAAGVILASDVFHSGSGVETLLFGSLLTIGGSDILWALVSAVAVVLGSHFLGRRWLVTGFDPGAAAGLGVRSQAAEMALLGLVALVAVASISAVGALLTTAVIVVPAATIRLLVTRLPAWQVASVLLAAAEGAIGLWISVELNAPPGSAIAVLSGCVFAAVAIGRWGVVSVRRAKLVEA